MSESTMTEVQSFDVGNFDLGDIKDSDLVTTRRIIKPGQYSVRIANHTLSMSENFTDGAGKHWGLLALELQDTEFGGTIKDFISVPIETAIYTSRARENSPSKTSTVKAKIFCNFMSVLTGTKIETANLAETVGNLHTLLKENDSPLTANIGFSGDHVAYIGKGDEDQPLFSIQLKSGERMLDSAGAPVSFDSRDDAVAYYEGVKGRKPSLFMNVKSYSKALQKV